MPTVTAKSARRRASTPPVNRARRRGPAPATGAPAAADAAPPQSRDERELAGQDERTQARELVEALAASAWLLERKRDAPDQRPTPTLLGLAVEALAVGHTDVVLGILEEACSSLEVLEQLAFDAMGDGGHGFAFTHVSNGIRHRLMLVHGIRHAELVAAEVTP